MEVGKWRRDQGTAKTKAVMTGYIEIKYNSRLLKLLHTYIKIIHKKTPQLNIFHYQMKFIISGMCPNSMEPK